MPAHQDLSSPGVPKQQVYLQQGVQHEGINVSGAPEVVLPPDSFLVLRLPFVYHTVEKNGNLRPLSYLKVPLNVQLGLLKALHCVYMRRDQELWKQLHDCEVVSD